ncbi:GLUG motif-containing protein [Caproiciproducens sp. R1]|uniref:GLUG motif-containing protein n=1 Tax=Caproiciproducens sp. R1 TaxID=3435000 RepID=UPI004033811B
MRKRISLIAVSMVMLFALCFSGCSSPEGSSAPAASAASVSSEAGKFAGGSGTQESPWVIETAQQLDAVREHLDGCYTLNADIDLASYEKFESIGHFEPASKEDEEAPDLTVAFTGVFNGNGHKISNVAVSAEKQSGVGLFGCVAGENGSVTDLVVENVKVSGNMLVGGVIGYGVSKKPVENITLQGTNSVAGNFLVGGIVGGGFCDIKNCKANADVTLNGDNAQGIGVLAGGMEESSIVSCSATGSVTVTGSGSYSIGGLAACGQAAPEVKDCTVDVKMTVGENCSMIGGLLGHAGNDAKTPTAISGCTVKADITAPASTERIGGIVGSGFFMQAYKEQRTEPNAFVVSDCTSTGSISAGSLTGTIAGYVYSNSKVEDSCTSDMTVGGKKGAPLVGGDKNTAGLDGLK